mgnify:CR=1 FL=1
MLPRQGTECVGDFRAWHQVTQSVGLRGGRDYDSDFATRMKGKGLWADLIRQRFEKACLRLGFNRERVELDVSQFRRPDVTGQGSLF